MIGIALLPYKLIQTKIDKIFTGKNREDHFVHKFQNIWMILTAVFWTTCSLGHRTCLRTTEVFLFILEI